MYQVKTLTFLLSVLVPLKTNQATTTQRAADDRTVILQRKGHFYPYKCVNCSNNDYSACV